MADAQTGLRVLGRLRQRAAPTQPDFADFGTAFGMELTLQADPLQAGVPAAREPGWWRRLSNRRERPAR